MGYSPDASGRIYRRLTVDFKRQGSRGTSMLDAETTKVILAF